MKLRLWPGLAGIVLLSLLACDSRDQGNSRSPKLGGGAGRAPRLPDGIYLVAVPGPGPAGSAEADRRPSSPGTLVIPYRHDFLDPGVDEPDSIEIVPSEYVLLELDREPEGIEQDDERLTLLLSMTQVATDQLADFTERHLGKRVAIVIDGQAVTQHGVKARIEGGKLQVTRCDDDACRRLLVELRDNVKRD